MAPGPLRGLGLSSHWVHEAQEDTPVSPLCHSAGRQSGEPECAHRAPRVHRGQAEAGGRELHSSHLPGKVSPHNVYSIEDRIGSPFYTCYGNTVAIPIVEEVGRGGLNKWSTHVDHLLQGLSDLCIHVKCQLENIVLYCVSLDSRFVL